jgi:methyl-accepting chemotaxis protein
MRFFYNLSIGTRLIIIFGSLITVLLISLGIRAYNTQKDALLEDIDTRMFEQLGDLAAYIELELDLNQERVEQLLKLSNKLFESENSVTELPNRTVVFEAENQNTGEQKKVRVNAWQAGSRIIQNSSYFVDQIQEMTGATATIFQKFDAGYLRISTNVRTDRGERAVGTYIPNSSEVIKTIERGETYVGRANVVGDWYLTAYKPLLIRGQIKGMLYVGVKEKNLVQIKEYYSEKVYLKEGYPFIISKDGTFIIHPTHQGESAQDEEFYQQIIESGKEVGKTYYEWEGRMKYQYFKYIERIDSYTVASIYEDTILNRLSKTRNDVILSVLLGFLFSVLIIFFFSRRLSKRLSGVVYFAEGIAQGDLTDTMDIKYNDEVGRMGRALNNMADKLKEIIENVQNGAEALLKAGEQVSSGSQELSQNSAEQASSLEEVSSTMEQIAANSEKNGRNAQITEQMSGKSAQGITKGAQTVKETVAAMNGIVEKIAIINAIAKKTDLLAINAAIEAARAGEDGKGFAVVAAEIRKLAERSSAAAEIIDEQSASSISVSNKATEQLSEIVNNIEKTALLIQEISQSAAEMSNGTNEVSDSIQKMNSVTQQTAAASEELATASEELTAQAESLNEIVHFFKLDEHANSSDNKHRKKETLDTEQHEPAKKTERYEEVQINLEDDDDTDVDDDRFESY